MVSVVEDSESDDQAKCLVRKFNNPQEKSSSNDFECLMDKNKTVRQFVHIVSQYYNLDVDSFSLTFSSFKSDEIRTRDKPKLVEDDDRFLYDIGLVFGKDSQNRFVLSENEQFEDEDQAECIVRIPKDMKSYQLTVDKNETAGQLYKRVVQSCQNDDLNTDNFVLTFNSYTIDITAELVKQKITEDDARLLSDIGVVYRQRVKNRFEVSLNNSSDNMDNDNSSKSCSPTQDQKIDGQYSKVHPSIRRNGLDSSSVIENNVLEPTSPMPLLALPSTRMLYSRSSERTITGYRGLVNQAMTCYLNSLLQALYMTPEFRNALYKWKFDFNANIDESKSIPFQLQKLFLNLQTSPRHSVETTELTRSFGWDSSEAWQQHDVQELCRVMFDALEQEFKNTTHVDLINQLYQGKMIDYVKCQECGIEKSREDTFLDIPLPIRPFGSTNAYGCITEALQGFIQPETLDGNNQYFCERCNKKCNAHKGLKFSKFPYIMTLHLMRFDFDYNTMHRIKLNDKVVFPLKLNLNSFISNNKNGLDKDEALSEGFPEELFGSGSKCDDSSYTGTDSSSALDEIDQDEDEGIDLNQHRHEEKRGGDSENEPIGPYMYELYAIMIHSGSASGGHYYAYIKDFKTDNWLCFNDQTVQTITMDDIEKSYGGGPVRGYYSGQYTSSTNAYMLMYRQIDHRRNKNAMDQEEFPPHLKELYSLLEKKAEEDRQIRERERDIYKVPVHLADFIFMENGVRSWQFDCSGTTTVDQLKSMAIVYFKVTKPCHLVIFNKTEQKVVENLEDRSNFLVCNLKYPPPCVLLLQVVETEDNGIALTTPGHVPMKLFLINLDDNEEDIDVSQPVEIEIEQNKQIGDLSDFLYSKYDIPRESILHFAIQSSSKPLVELEETVLCSSVYTNYVFVFIERRAIGRSAIMHKMKNIISRYDNTILLQFLMPTKDSEMLQKLNMLYNKNSMNGYSKNLSKESLEKQITDVLEDCELLPDDNNLAPNPDDMLILGVGNSSGDQSEDSSITDSERTIKGDTVKDYQMESSRFENDPIKVYDNGRLEENWDGTEDDDDEDNEFQLNEKYFFKTLDNKTSENDEERLYAYVDKRMTVKELKNHLVPYIHIPSDFIILNRCKSDTCQILEELALPSSSLEDLNYSDTIQISMGQALHDGEYRGVIFWPEPLDQTQIVMKKMFDWIITVGTSVLDSKKELLAKLYKTKNIEIPLERCRLRKKKGDALMRCYFNEEIWNEDIGQGWEMVILDLKDRSELELGKTKRLMFVNHVEENGSQQRLISEMEFVVDIASTTSPNSQLATEISKKLNIPEDQLELGYMHGHSTDIVWKTSVSNWLFSLSDDNTILFCRNGNVDTNSKEASSKWRSSRPRKERSLRIQTVNND